MTENGIGDARHQAEALTPKRRSLAFATLIVAFSMDVLDSTIVNVAVPSLRQSLGASSDAVQWMVAGYSTTFAMLLISGGRLGDIFGYRRMFMLGMAGFTLASLGCGLAPDATTLIVARLAQGAAAAVMGPQVLALIQLLYPPAERVRVLSFFGILGGLAAVAGPILGGAIINADVAGLGWRPIFLLNVPVGVAGLVAAAILLPKGRSAHPLRVDVPGNILVVLTLFLLVFPLIEGPAFGWPAWSWAMLGSAPLVAAATFVQMRRRSARGHSSLIEASLFRDSGFTVGVAISLVFSTATGGFLLVLTLCLQIGLGLDPLSAGLIHVPFAIGVGLGVSVIGRRFLPAAGKTVLTAGALVMAAAIGALPFVLDTADPPMTVLGATLLIAGLGMGAVAGPLTPVALARVDTRHAGGASGLLKSVQQLGSAVGPALIGSIFLAASGGARTPVATRDGFPLAAASVIVLLLTAAIASRLLRSDLFEHDRPLASGHRPPR